ncbi:hypothetical protein [uncultured Jatrophihabitans sp.]|uniref:hypothetical protein n=1 Tax=uncultured Jatrophihabitans sp. TaxID=1610747 RepID=UPI0035CC78A7
MTAAAAPRHEPDLVTTARQLLAGGVSRGQLDARVDSGRWQRLGLAIVLHNGPLSPAEQRRVARVHGGPRAVFTAFTAAALGGLTGWTRPEHHLLVPPGTRLRFGCPVPVRLHQHGRRGARLEPGRPLEWLPDALVRAASTFGSPRPACGVLAASVQQRVVTAAALDDALGRAIRTRHRTELVAALVDIGGGSQALSEIDFVRLCRRHRLPEPIRQAVRREPSGRRRYLDAAWRRADGRLIVVEIDGAVHLSPRRWWDDQLRQNEISLADALVLRFPSVVLRTEELMVVSQLRRALRVL